LAVACMHPARQAFLAQVVPARWFGSVQGLEQTSVQVAALVGTLVAPFLYGHLSGRVISLAGVIALLGGVYAAPILLKEWRRLSEVKQDRAEERTVAS
jgi:MFS family permease